MHPCLSVDEILRLIFGFIDDRGSTLCALARTCRTFHEPAMDLIWETLTTFEPVLLNLPSARILSTEDRCLTLSRPLSDNDWNVVRRRSSHVRRLHTFVDLEPHYLYAVPPWFSFLTSPPDSSFLFPQLRVLSIEAEYINMDDAEELHTEIQAHLRYLHLLLRPHLSALRFHIPGLFYPHLDLPSIPVLCPNLRILNIVTPNYEWDGLPTPHETAYPFSSVVSELCNLEFVESDMTSWDLLSSLSQAKALRKLSVRLPRELGIGPECPSGDIFPQLRTLDIRASSLASCTDLFHWISLHQVTEIDINCLVFEDDIDAFQALVDMTSLIPSRCKPLEFFWFRFSVLPTAVKTYPTWPRLILEPYHVCHHLRVIALETSLSITLADNDLEDLVMSWPHLEVFHLFQRDMNPPPVHLTLRGVTALLCHCRKLTHFTLMFDATRVPEDAAQLAPETLPTVTYMGVDGSPVSQSSDVAAYLSILMPLLESIGVREEDGYGPEWHWICAQHQRRPAIRVDMSPMKLYSLLTAGNKYASERTGRGWEWTYRRHW
ncbi:hypothetical protein EDC04DRAFT_453299 [Pisolithus marmoratus]|nr:hypothetical protein EDC04DRAFT_453299 [Pisolithus marmoratus]